MIQCKLRVIMVSFDRYSGMHSHQKFSLEDKNESLGTVMAEILCSLEERKKERAKGK